MTNDVYGPLTLTDSIAAHLPAIKGLCFNMTRSVNWQLTQQNLDDYVHACFIACVERIARFNGENFKGYILTTTVWTVRTLRKADQRERQRLGDNAALGTIFAALPDRDTRKRIKMAWDKLPTNHRKILRAHFAGKLGSTVAERKQLSRSRKALADLMSQS